METKPAAVEPCDAGAQSPSYFLLSSQLREFDDASLLAINMPREQVVDQVVALQSIRRETEQMPVPDCAGKLKARMVGYMNQVVDLLVAFVGGVSPDLVFRGLEDSGVLRGAMEGEMAAFVGATLTPYPTPYQFAALVTVVPSIPVTGEGTGLAAVMAVVSNERGANLRQEPSSESALVSSLALDTQVEVLGASPDLLWIYVKTSDGLNGWLYAELISVGMAIEDLPVIE
jgi:hypothetical protein